HSVRRRDPARRGRGDLPARRARRRARRDPRSGSGRAAMTDFLDLPDLACEAAGGAALAANDEFFAEKDNLLRDHAAVWKDQLYTDRGKWMDGWETRRRR